MQMNITEEYGPLFRRLCQFYSWGEAHDWMRKPHPQLNGRRAIDCKFDEVAPILDRLESGAYL